MSPIAPELLSKLPKPNAVCTERTGPRCVRFLPSLASEGGPGPVYGIQKGSLEQPALERRGQEKPELEALKRVNPMASSVSLLGEQVEMSASSATANDAGAAGLMTTNSV